MLTIISFAFLGVWTVILGIINNKHLFITSPTDIRMLAQESEEQRSKDFNHKSVHIEDDTSLSETLIAFKNLWKEITFGDKKNEH